MAAKLKRSIHNQLDVTASPLQQRKAEDVPSKSKELILRKYDLYPALPEVLLQCKPHASQVTKLDISFSIADFQLLGSLCSALCCLRILHAKSCGLVDVSSASGSQATSIPWPRGLRDLDLSRNRLTACPEGVTQLMHLSKLNLSGNRIRFVPPALLQIPHLERCLLLSNPVSNIPKEICREGVERMRGFLAVEPLPLPQGEEPVTTAAGCGEAELERNESELGRKGAGITRRHNSSVSSLEGCGNLRRFVLRSQGSFESGYETPRPSSPSLCPANSSSGRASSLSSDLDYYTDHSDIMECDPTTSPSCSTSSLDGDHDGWRVFDSAELVPESYVEKTEDAGRLCRVYLPGDCAARVQVQEVRDLSLHPRLGDDRLLITPVVEVTPHGLCFDSQPAIVVLSHCLRNGHTHHNFRPLPSMNLVVLCSSTERYRATEWTRVESDCQIFADHVMFKTFHFSLFAVAAVYPYPSSSLEVQPGVGGALLLPELPGFSLRIPDSSMQGLRESVEMKATLYYCDESFRACKDHAPASACIGFEPHGMEFDSPVEVSIPVSDYAAIRVHFPDAKLELWCSQSPSHEDAATPSQWKQVEDLELELERSDECALHVVRFRTSHFSWYELLWTLCTSPLQKLGLGAASAYGQLANRARYVAVRFQAFMSQPEGGGGGERGHWRTFGLAVTVYKFGNPLATPSNYPLLVAESGDRRMYLRTGELQVSVEGACFTASAEVGESLERSGRILDFNGEDFCERFEFALSLKREVVLPLQRGQVLGKLCFVQWEESSPIHKSYNLIMVRHAYIFIVRSVVHGG